MKLRPLSNTKLAVYRPVVKLSVLVATPTTLSLSPVDRYRLQRLCIQIASLMVNEPVMLRIFIRLSGGGFLALAIHPHQQDSEQDDANHANSNSNTNGCACAEFCIVYSIAAGCCRRR